MIIKYPNLPFNYLVGKSQGMKSAYAFACSFSFCQQLPYRNRPKFSAGERLPWGATVFLSHQRDLRGVTTAERDLSSEEKIGKSRRGREPGCNETEQRVSSIIDKISFLCLHSEEYDLLTGYSG